MVFIHFCSQLRRKNILSFLAVKTMQSLKFTNTSSHQQTLVHYFSKVLPSSALNKDRKHDTYFPCSHPGRVTAREYCHFQGILKLQASLQNRAFGLLAIPHLPDRSVQGLYQLTGMLITAVPTSLPSQVQWHIVWFYSVRLRHTTRRKPRWGSGSDFHTLKKNKNNSYFNITQDRI